MTNSHRFARGNVSLVVASKPAGARAVGASSCCVGGTRPSHPSQGLRDLIHAVE